MVKLQWLKERVDDPYEIKLGILDNLNNMSADDATVLKIVRLPFLDTLDWGDRETTKFLAELTISDPDGLIELISHPSVIGDESGPLQLLYLTTKDSAAAAEIAGLDWVMDGLEFHEHEALTLWQEAARQSKGVFRHLMDESRSWLRPGSDLNNDVIKALIDMSVIDEGVALRVLQMPFLETIEFIDIIALERLGALLESNPEALSRVLSNAAIENNITDEKVIHVLILYLEEIAPEMAEAINNLAWVQDGITYLPPRDWGNLSKRPEEAEAINVYYLFVFSIDSPDFLRELTGKPWFQDDVNGLELSMMSYFNALVLFDRDVALQMLRMPFLDEIKDQDVAVLQLLTELRWWEGDALRKLLANPALAGGIRDDNLGIVRLLEAKTRDSEDTAALENLTWIQDGVSASEYHAVSAMTVAAVQTDRVFSALLEKPWVWDGLTQEESLVVRSLVSMSRESYSNPKTESTLNILEMPFLDSIEPIDPAVVRALDRLSWVEDGSYLRQVLDHPSLNEGITDEDALTMVLLGQVSNLAPKMFKILLDPANVYTQERAVSLPLGGETRLAVVRTAPGTFRTLDILEDIVRQQEDFIGIEFPSKVVNHTQCGPQKWWRPARVHDYPYRT